VKNIIQNIKFNFHRLARIFQARNKER